MNPVCVKCQCEMKCKKTGAGILIIIKPDVPYQLWHGDEWTCPNCGIEVVSGFGRSPIAESYQDDFKSQVDAEKVIVNCYVK